MHFHLASELRPRLQLDQRQAGCGSTRLLNPSAQEAKAGELLPQNKLLIFF